jgi:hypothetical protein
MPLSRSGSWQEAAGRSEPSGGGTSSRTISGSEGVALRKELTQIMKGEKRKPTEGAPRVHLDVDSIKRFSTFATKGRAKETDAWLFTHTFFKVIFFPLFFGLRSGSRTDSMLYAFHVFSIWSFRHVANTFELYNPVLLLFFCALGYAHLETLSPSTKPMSGTGDENVPLALESDDDDDDSDDDDGGEMTDDDMDDGKDNEGEQDSKYTDQNFRLNATMWNPEGKPAKIPVSMMDIRGLIVEKVRATKGSHVYRALPFRAAVAVALLPLFQRLYVHYYEFASGAGEDLLPVGAAAGDQANNAADLSLPLSWAAQCLPSEFEPVLLFHQRSLLFRMVSLSFLSVCRSLSLPSICVMISGFCATLRLARYLLKPLADAELTYHRRLVYAKCFCALTSAGRARRYGLPHFRLKDAVNIKVWLSLRADRAWLKQQGKQVQTDAVVSTSFYLLLGLVSLMLSRIVNYPSEVASTPESTPAHGNIGSAGTGPASAKSPLASADNMELLAAVAFVGIYLLRIMMVGAKINMKYSDTSVLMAEQMNCYLKTLHKPHKKEKLMLSKNTPKLATKMLQQDAKKAQSGISGFPMNPLLYHTSNTDSAALGAISGTLGVPRIQDLRDA